jgi:putative acetyltransferase
MEAKGDARHQRARRTPPDRALRRAVAALDYPDYWTQGDSLDDLDEMDIRRAEPTDCEVLLDVWLRSVRATHSFVSEEDIQSMIPQVRDYLASSAPDFWVVCDGSGAVMGFMGMSGSKMGSLFLAPEFQRLGAGRRLVRHAQTLYGELTVDVNEQNVAARGFYEACGFVVVGRSDQDEQGRPYPLLQMRWPAPSRRCT